MLAAAIGGLGLQSTATFPRLVVVVDGDAAAADPRAAARLRETLLEQIDPTTAASYFELTATGLKAIAADDAATFRRTVFTVTPPTYAGVRVTFTESVEILRGNEAVRETVIARGCGGGECGGRVRAAVMEDVRRQEATSARKLQQLVAQAAGWPGARVVLVTAGWPIRGDDRLDLGRAVRALRERSVSLHVVRVPPAEPYRGLVRDASESLAARLPARFAILADEADVSAAAAVIGAGGETTANAATPSPAATTHATETATATPESAAAPADAPAAPHGAVSPGDIAEGDATLRRAAAYVARFERTFTEVIWHERYEQELRVWRRFSSSGALRASPPERRLLESELFFAWLPKDGTWISVRDVLAVDGKRRASDQRRLSSLAARGSVSLLELRELALENGRFNIGSIVRTFNEPTLALQFLSERHRARANWSRKGLRRSDGRAVVTYAFTEQRRPTVIRSGDRDMPVRGTFDLDDATGQVLASTIELSEPLAAGAAFPALTGRMTVDYRPHVAFDVLVPLEMRESYNSHDREEVTATASYSDFRRFGTAGRLILSP